MTIPAKSQQLIQSEKVASLLDPNDSPLDPFSLFEEWFLHAQNFPVKMPEAMCLSTINSRGIPVGRFVLLRGSDARGFQFFTNSASDKGTEMFQNPAVSLTFHWTEMERQVRIEGYSQKISDEESDKYWATRPLGHQISAASSDQSKLIGSQKEMQQKVDRLKAMTSAAQSIPRPPHWCGYRVVPVRIEFWQGRANRLHDRCVFERDIDPTAVLQVPEKQSWKKFRLQP